MADQTVSLELTADASDLVEAVQESGQAMEEMADAGTQAAADIEAAMSGQDSMWDTHATAINATAAAAGAAGLAFEGLARKQQDNRAVAGRLANRLDGETTDSIMRLASELHDATTDMDDLVHAMEVGAQQGLETGRDLQVFASFWDMVADATGESHAALADASVALRSVGIAAGDESHALGAFGFVAEQTTGSVGDFLTFIERTGPELRDLGADIDDAAAIMGVLESEFGMSGRTARSEFRSAISDSDGTLQGLLDTLGVSPGVFADYRDAVDESTGVIEANAEAYADSRTVTQELWADLEALAARFSGVTSAASAVSPVLTGAGGAAWGFGQLRQATRDLPAVLGGVRTALSGMSSFLLGPWGIAIAAATIGVGLFVKSKKEAEQRTNELRATLDAETAALTENTEAMVVNRLQQDGAITAARELGISMETLVGAAMGVPGAMNDVDDAINEALSASDSRFGAEEAVRTLSGSVVTLRDDLGEAVTASREEAEAMAELEGRYLDVAHALDSGLTPAQAEAAIALQDAAEAAGDNEEAVEGAGDAYETTAGQTLTAAEAIDEYIAANRRATDPVFRLMDAIQKVDDAQQTYTDAVEEYGAESDEAADASINLMQRLGDLERAAIDGDVSFTEFENQLDRWVDQGRITEEQAALIRDRVSEARDEANQFEGTRSIVFNASGNAFDRIPNLNAQIAAMPLNVQFRATAGGMEFRAEGGPVMPGRPYIVGEEGPELVTFGQRGLVHTAEATSQLLAGGVGSSTAVTIPVMIDVDGVAREVGRSQAFIDAHGRTTLKRARLTADV